MYPHCTHIFAKWCNDLQKGFRKFGCMSMIQEKFDLNGVADLGLKVVRLSPPRTHSESLLSGFFFLGGMKCTHIVPTFGCTHFAEREMIPEISCDICGIVTKNLKLLCKFTAKLSKNRNLSYLCAGELAVVPSPFFCSVLCQFLLGMHFLSNR